MPEMVKVIVTRSNDDAALSMDRKPALRVNFIIDTLDLSESEGQIAIEESIGME